MASYLKTVQLVLQAFGTGWPSGAAMSSSSSSTCAKPAQSFSWRSLSGKRTFCSPKQPSRHSADIHSQLPGWARPELLLQEDRQTGSSPCWWKMTLPFPSPAPPPGKLIHKRIKIHEVMTLFRSPWLLRGRGKNHHRRKGRVGIAEFRGWRWVGGAPCAKL